MFLEETNAYLSSSRTSVNVFLTSTDDVLKVAVQEVVRWCAFWCTAEGC